MRAAFTLSALGVALFGASVAACAGIVGADFDDVHGSALSIDAGHLPKEDSGPTIFADGGVCPTGLTDCAGLCYALASDPDHCNDCDTACPADPSGRGAAVCTGGSCTFACPRNSSLCSGSAGCCTMSGGVDSGNDSGLAPDPGIVCGTKFCPTANGGFCCGDDQVSPGGDVCGDNNTTQGQVSCVYVLTCSSSGECPSSSPACCYDTNDYDPQGDTEGQTSLCLATCPSSPYRQLCNPAASGECPGGETCSETFTSGGQLQATYYFCQ